MKTFLLATGALVLASASPVLAQDSSAPAPTETSAQAPAATSTFTGPRLEIFGGYDRVGVRSRFNDGTTRDVTKGHKSGYTAGALAGYDMPIGNTLVAGVYGSYAISNAKACSFGGPGVGGGCFKDGRTIEGGARIGAKVGGKTLVYAKGAYVNGQLHEAISDGNEYVANGHANRDGWRAGAGVEYALNAHTYVKAEYDYTRYGNLNADRTGITDTSLRVDRNQAVAGFGVRF